MGCADVPAEAGRLKTQLVAWTCEVEEAMASEVITVPSFATGADGVEHFFGTRLSALSVTPGRASAPGAPRRDRAATVMVSVKQVHGTDALVVDQPVRQGDAFEGGWDALVTNQPGCDGDGADGRLCSRASCTIRCGGGCGDPCGLAGCGGRYRAEDRGLARQPIRGDRRGVADGDRSFRRSLLLRGR